MAADIERERMERLLDAHAALMKRYLSHCMHCSMCAESCFMYMNKGKDPKYMPSYKVINSVGRLYRRRGRIDRRLLEQIKPIVFRHCVLCQRCYCPVGVSVPRMIALARAVCRAGGVFPTVDAQGRHESWL